MTSMSDRVAAISDLLPKKLWQHREDSGECGENTIVESWRSLERRDPDALVWRGCTDLPVHQQGIRVLGTPLGQPEFVVEQLREVS